MAALGGGQEHGAQAVVQLDGDADEGGDDAAHHLLSLQAGLHLVVMDTQVVGSSGGGGAGGLRGEEVGPQQRREHGLQLLVSAVIIIIIIVIVIIIIIIVTVVFVCSSLSLQSLSSSLSSPSLLSLFLSVDPCI